MRIPSWEQIRTFRAWPWPGGEEGQGWLAWLGAGAIVVIAALVTAVEQFPDLPDLLGGVSTDRQLLRLEKQAETLYRKGVDAGDNRALAAAVDRRNRIVALISREQAPLDWAAAQHELGEALFKLGEREPGPARLEEAVVAYRAALEERTRARVPSDRATTENDLGVALEALGERSAGAARLDEAVAAFHAALEERTRERVPFEWATTENNLGNALVALGARGGGAQQLEEAAAAFRAALQEWTRELAPVQWAATQNNLGNALVELGAREPGTARLEEAVAAYRTALGEYKRERVPLDWAQAENNLGLALAMLGARETGTARLEEAVAAYRAALEERTRARVPLKWAATESNLAKALQILGVRERGTENLKEADAAYRKALEVFTRERSPMQSAVNVGGQGLVLMAIAERNADAATADEAVAKINEFLPGPLVRRADAIRRPHCGAARQCARARGSTARSLKPMGDPAGPPTRTPSASGAQPRRGRDRQAETGRLAAQVRIGFRGLGWLSILARRLGRLGARWERLGGNCGARRSFHPRVRESSRPSWPPLSRRTRRERQRRCGWPQ